MHHNQDTKPISLALREPEKDLIVSIEATKEYLNALWLRYRKARKKEKTLILNEFCEVCKFSRKHAIKRLAKGFKEDGAAPGPKVIYGVEVVTHLKNIYFAMDQMCSKKMVAALPLWLPHYSAVGFTDEIRAKLLKISASSIDRLLKPIRAQTKRGLSTTKPGSILKKRIPIQTQDWNITKPGFIEADTVAHCDDRTSGSYVNSVTMTDIYSGWTENRACWTKGSDQVQNQIQDIEQSLPFPMLGFDSDNGSEFLTYALMNYFEVNRKTPVAFTRCRPYRKNDQAHVEQKNWTHVRQLFGYERFDLERLVPLMNDIYKNYWNPYHNFFVPSVKLIHKERVGAKIIKKHDKPKTPYQRLMDSADVDIETKQHLKAKYDTMNPFDLKKALEKKLKTFFELLRQHHTAKVA